MANEFASVFIASAQSVAKVFVIGGVGWASVKYPRKAPFLPASLVGTVARFTFHTFTIPLIYGTIAQAVTIESIGDYWSVIVGGWVVLSVSYIVATIIHWWFLPISNRRDFVALRVAVTYPNIVALPILIFPSLCEFPVVYEGYSSGWSNTDTTDVESGTTTTEGDDTDLRKECVDQSTTMIFCYFFAWSLAFWSFGNPQLMNAATTLSSTNPITATTTRRRDPVDGNATTDDDDATRTAPVVDQDDSPSIGTKSSLDEDQDDSNDDRTQIKDGKRQSNDIQQLPAGGECHSEEVTIPCSQDNLRRTALLQDHCETSTTPDSDPVVECNNGRHAAVEQSSKRQQQPSSSPSSDVDEGLHHQSESIPVIIGNNNPSSSITEQFVSSSWQVLGRIWTALRMTVTSPGFVAMVLAFVTACIPPLQQALFEPGGALRFLGSAIESLGTASAPISTMVVAASLVPPSTSLPLPDEDHNEAEDDEVGTHHPVGEEDDDDDDDDGHDSYPVIDERPGMTDPNFGPYQRRRRRRRRQRRRRSSLVSQLGRSVRSSTIRMMHAIPRSTPEMRRIHLWFNLSRLVVTPAVIVGIVLALDCTGSGTPLANVPDLAKLVLIVNASLPGALIIVVLLKSNEELADTAAAVSRAYLPNYLLSIITIAAWTGLGLYVTLPDEDGNTFCQR